MDNKIDLAEWIKQEKSELGQNAFHHPNTVFFKVLHEINEQENSFVANSGDLVDMALKHSDTYNILNEKDKGFVKFWLEEEIFFIE